MIVKASTRKVSAVPLKKCEKWSMCGNTLSSRSEFTKCQSCRNADKRYSERLKTDGVGWFIAQLRRARLRESRMLPFAGKKITEIRKLPAMLKEHTQ